MMSSPPFALNDIVWCHSATSSNIWPAKIVVDPLSGDWTKDEKLFLQFYGPVRCQTGKWIAAKNVVGFETFSDRPSFNNSGLTEAFALAKAEFTKNGSRKHVKVAVKQCKPENKNRNDDETEDETKSLKTSSKKPINYNDDDDDNVEDVKAVVGKDRGPKKIVKQSKPMIDDEDDEDYFDNFGYCSSIFGGWLLFSFIFLRFYIFLTKF